MLTPELTADTVLQKTALGVQEIALRQLGLPQRERSLLILIDGKATLGKVLRVVPEQELAQQLLADLVTKGLVESLPESAPKAAAINRATALTPAQFVQLKKNASHWLEDILGVDAQRLCLLLEQCPTKEAFDTRFEKTVHIVAQMTNPAKAAAYQERVLTA